MDKTRERLEKWCAGDWIDFSDDDAERRYKERSQRIADAVQLKVPDRVPVELCFGVFPALSNGYTAEDILFDHDKIFDAYQKSILYLQADTFRMRAAQGHLLEFIEARQVKLPGRGISVDSNLQYVEKEYGSADEFYEGFLSDPTDYIMRVHWPRILGILEPLKDIRSFHTGFSYYLGMPGILGSLGAPGVAEAFEKLCQAGRMMREHMKLGREKILSLLRMGFPADSGGGAHAPFDTIGDFVRGTQGIMLDMFRRPHQLIAAMEKLVPMTIEMALQAKKSPSPFVFIPLHKGIEGFMSLEQYKTFYWPTLKQVVLGIIAEGLVPILFFEGENTSRLEVIADIPKGKAIYHFEKVDLHKAKEILGDTVCFRGNVPVSLLNTGNPEQVKDYVRTLIDVVGKGGGLIVDSGAIFDEAKLENVKAMVDFTKEYGVYK